MAKSLYDLKKVVVAPLEQLLDAVLAVNVYLLAARDAGWEVELSVLEVDETLSIGVRRDDWPSDIDGERVS